MPRVIQDTGQLSSTQTTAHSSEFSDERDAAMTSEEMTAHEWHSDIDMDTDVSLKFSTRYKDSADL
jgi:hypothetical protein